MGGAKSHRPLHSPAHMPPSTSTTPPATRNAPLPAPAPAVSQTPTLDQAAAAEEEASGRQQASPSATRVTFDLQGAGRFSVTALSFSANAIPGRTGGEGPRRRGGEPTPTVRIKLVKEVARLQEALATGSTGTITVKMGSLTITYSNAQLTRAELEGEEKSAVLSISWSAEKVDSRYS